MQEESFNKGILNGDGEIADRPSGMTMSRSVY